MISKELHSRCFLDNFWLTWLKKTGGLKIGATNHFWETSWNYSTAEGEKIMIAAQARQQPKTSSERGTSLTTCQYHFECFSANTALWEISFTSTALHTKKDSEHLTNSGKKVSSWSLRPQEDNLKKKSKTRLLCWSLSIRLLDQTVLSKFRQLTPVCRRSYVHRKEIALLEFSPQFSCLLNVSLTHLSEADRMIEYKPILTVTTSAAVKQTWANRALW